MENFSSLACVGRLKNQVALITGASSGIGREIALAMADEGADVIVNYIGNEKAARELAHEIRRKGVCSVAVKADVSDEDQVRDMFEKAVEQLGDVRDIGSVAVWLASDESDYVHGTTLVVDGGMMLYPGFATGG